MVSEEHRPDYFLFLEKTAQEAADGLENPEVSRTEALDRFRNFFQSMTVEMVEAQCKKVYAKNAILHDTLATVYGHEEIAEYFLKTAERAAGVEVDVFGTLESGPDIFIQWRMDIAWSAFGKKTTSSVGMSHLRFNSAGEVILHVDFWDSTSGFFEHLPVLGRIIRWIKARVEA